MKVLIFEQFTGGHYTNYCRHLIEKFMFDKRVTTLYFATTEKHFQTEAFDEYKNCESKLKFISIPDNVGNSGNYNDRKTIFNNLLSITKNYQIDVIISSTVDFISTFAALYSTAGYKPFKNIKTIGVFHYGYGKEIVSKNDYLKRIIYSLTYRLSPWSYKMFVNPIVYDNIKKQKNMYLLSDPVQVNKIYPIEEARERLNIDKSARIIGYIGNIDKRKALLEFLEAYFSIEEFDIKDKVLLMGRLDKDYKEFIMKNYSKEINNGRLIIIDKHLSYDEMELGLGACNLVSVLYHPTSGLSANMLYAVCSGKRVIASEYGYTGMMIDKFDVGVKCNSRDINSIKKAIKDELNINNDKNNTNINLIEYYKVENFQNLIGNLVLGSGDEVRSWDNVLD